MIYTSVIIMKNIKNNRKTKTKVKLVGSNTGHTNLNKQTITYNQRQESLHAFYYICSTTYVYMDINYRVTKII